MSKVEKPTLFKRLAALIYDSLLILAAMIILAFVWKLLLSLVGLDENQIVLKIGYNLIIFGLLFGFYQYFWLKGGQTLGMTAWRLQLQRNDGADLNFKTTAARWCYALLSAACLGLGYWWCLFDKEKRTWHDILSKTHLTVLPKKK